VIHALIWHPDAAGELAYSKLKSRKGVAEWVSAPASVNDLTAVAEELYQTAKAVADFMVKHFQTNRFPPPFGDGALYGPSVRAAIVAQKG